MNIITIHINRLLITILLFIITTNGSEQTTSPHVCIIGGGITAASASYFLTTYSPSIQLTVFEQSHQVGGRIKSLNISQVPTPIEAGASIIANSNQLMSHFTKILNLTSELASTKEESIGLWNATYFSFNIPSNNWQATFKVAIRYHLSLIRSKLLLTNTLNAYDRLYPKNGVNSIWIAENSVKNLFQKTQLLFNLSQLSFLNVTNSFSSLYLNELVAAIIRCNYGQDPSMMNAISGLVALAGSGQKLWYVKGGNQQIVHGLLNRKGINLKLKTKIQNIQFNNKNSNTSPYTLEDQNGECWYCNAVILAAPIELTDLQLPNEIRKKLQVGRNFQKTVTTFVQAKLNENTFGINPPTSIYTTAGVKDVFTAIAQVWDGGKQDIPIFKVFSKESLSSDALSRMFQSNPKVIAEYPWFAYPQFNIPEKFADFDIDDEKGGAFIYTSPLESAGSAMEMSAVSGANAAFLVRKKLGLDINDNSKEELEKEDL